MLTLTLILLTTAIPASSSTPWRVPELAARMAVDGVLSEEAWSQALVVELPYEVDPGDSVPAPVKTTALFFSTETTLYVGFLAYDPNPQEIRAHLADRDQFFRDDYVGIMLDTFGDRRRAYQFFVNPLGVQGDSLRTVTGEGDREDGSWDAIWTAASKLTSTGYTVEMAIPFAALRFPSGSEEKRFGFAAFRAYPRSLRRMLFSVPLDRDNACMLCQLPYLVGFASARPGRSVELIPTWVAGREQKREDDDTGMLSQPTIQGQGGISLLWGLTPNLTLAATVNPDFSQVEADSKQLAINRVFSLFFPEKRPFFLEGTDAFSTPVKTVHTRTFANPDWGVKLVGKEGANTLGALVVRDQITPLVLPGPQSSGSLTLQQPSTGSVLRWRHDLNTNASLGLLATDRRGDGWASTTGGLDGFFRPSPKSAVTFQWLKSSTHYPASPELGANASRKVTGTALWASFSHQSRNWEAWAEAKNVQEGFRADLGFVPQVGVRGAEMGAQRVLWGQEGSWYSVLRLGGEVEHWEDQAGNLLSESQRVMARYQGPLQSFAVLTLTNFRESWKQQTFSGISGRIFANVRFTGDFTVSCRVERGDAVDYEGNRPGKKWAFAPGFTWNLGKRFYLQGDFLAESLAVDEGNLYRAYIAESRFMVFLGVQSFIRLLTQYSILRTWPQRFSEPPEKVRREWNHQLLFAYKLNPQTLLFVGASDGEAGTSQRWAVTRERSIFLKLSYNWQA